MCSNTASNGSIENPSLNCHTPQLRRPRIAFIGGGNMAEAILGGLINHGFLPQEITISEPVADRAQFFLDTYSGVRVLQGDNSAAVTGKKSVKLVGGEIEVAAAEVVVLAVKPQIMRTVAMDLRDTIESVQPLVISIAAGIRTRDIARWLTARSDGDNEVAERVVEEDEQRRQSNISIVRCMPNTPALILEGAAGLYPTEHVTKEQKKVAEDIIAAVSKRYSWVDDETLIDTVTALSGSGPAYCFLMMEVMENAAVDLGLPRDIAHNLTIQTFVGASKMAQANQATISLEELRHRVTSPNGTTEAALKSMEKGKFSTIVSEAVKAADHRSKEIAEQFGKL